MLKIFKKLKNLKYKNQKKGIALVIAITVMTLLLSISFSISNIVLRQIRITNTNNESKPSFFIADSAVECAFYYDTVAIVPDPISGIDVNKDFTTSIFGQTSKTEAEGKIKCGDYTSILGLGAPLNLQKNITPDKVITTFDIVYGDKCARVEVTRTEVETNIVSRGYNTGVNAAGDGCDLTNLDTRRLVERGLTITY
jgi:hypothetical protein